MTSALANFCHSFANTLIHIWAIVFYWCSFRWYFNPDVVVDLEQGLRRPQTHGHPPPVPSSPPPTPSPGSSSFCPEYASSPFRQTTHQAPAAYNPCLPQTTITPSDPDPDLEVPNTKAVDGRFVPTSFPVDDDMSASGANAKSVSVSYNASGALTVHKDSPPRLSISTSTSSSSVHVRSASFNVLKGDQNLKSSRPVFIDRPLSPPIFPSRNQRGKGHKRAPLATITNISYVMGPSSPVVETFIIPEPSSAVPLIALIARKPCKTPTPQPLISRVADQITGLPPSGHGSTHSPCPSPPVSPRASGSALIPATPKSLRRVPAFDNLHSLSPSRKPQRASPSPSPRKRPVSSVVWFRDSSITPTTPLRITKRRAGLPPSPPTRNVGGYAGATEEELEEEVLAVKKVFAATREEADNDEGLCARERFNRASVWTTRAEQSFVLQLDEHMRNILDEEEDDSDDEGYGEELQSSSLTMNSPPPPYPLSLPVEQVTDKMAYNIPTADSLPPVSESTELSYLRSTSPFSSFNDSFDNLLLSFEDLIASMPLRLKTPEELSQASAGEATEAKANERVPNRELAERRDVDYQGSEGDTDGASHDNMEEINSTVSQSARDRHWSDDFELDAYVEIL